MGCICQSTKNKINDINNDNYIIAEINIKEDDINKNIRIINSYEEYHNNWDFKEFNEYKKNKEYIENCEIQINDKSIPFSYFHSFKSIKKYTIKYSFNNNLTNINHMFYGCEYLTNLDFSNFNSENVMDMESMFAECKSLINVNLSNFNTEKVNNMNNLFKNCESLTNLDLSNFNLKNISSMCYMFEGCKSLTYLNLYNFKTDKINEYDIEDIFDGCVSLKKQNIITQDKKILNFISNT